MDPNLFSLLDPDPGGTFDKKKNEKKSRKLVGTELLLIKIK